MAGHPSDLWFRFIAQAKKDNNSFVSVMERDVDFPGSMGSFEYNLYKGHYDAALRQADGKNRETLRKIGY